MGAAVIWFTADEHYGHTNIIEYAGRPFSSIDEMDSTIIARHNEVVKKGDTVIHLGDVTFIGTPETYVSQLNGQHFLIKGNHDHRGLRKRPHPFIWVRDVETVKWEEYRFFLSHYAHLVWPRSHYGVIHLHGHSHGTLASVGRAMDVGVDTNNYYPYSAEEVIARMTAIPLVQMDHHKIKAEL